MEDQGWVAWFMIQIILGRSVTVFGDGKQVRDLLYIDDLMDIFDLVINNPDRSAGEIFNVGGGPNNSLAIWSELQPILTEISGRLLSGQLSSWRPGDQRVFISDISKLQRTFNWQPRVGIREGIERLYSWINENQALFT
jgi:CDP-paratose 2-epimerase